MSANQVIVIGGGLAGLSTAHTVIEHGGSVLLLDKCSFLGGNSTKATSGINGTPTQAQTNNNVKDGVEQFIHDINASYYGGKNIGPVHPLVRDLGRLSGPSIDWLITKFGLDLSILGLLGGHSAPRTHRGKERFPGMTITYALMDALEKVEKKSPELVKIILKARVVEILKDASTGTITGCVYVKDVNKYTANGPVVVATGGFGADYTPNSLLAAYRPEFLKFATTNGDHCTGDGIKMGEGIGAGLVDMEHVQVHPTGLVDPKEPDAKVKFLAAEALRGTGAIMLNGNGERFVNELGRRKDVSETMFKDKGPFRLVLNTACSSEILWHCKHYTGRGLMKHFKSGAELAKDIGVSPSVIDKTFHDYNAQANAKKEPFGKPFFKNTPFDGKDAFYVALITPVVHYTMGGLLVNELAEVLEKTSKKPLPGLYCAGECAGGVHGVNRLGGNSLLDCVVFGRVAGKEVCSYILKSYLGPGAKRVGVLSSHIAPPSSQQQQPTAATIVPEKIIQKPTKKFSVGDVSKHDKETDCWVIIDKMVLDVTKFMPDHPGGKKAIMLFVGKDATDEFDMLHKREVIDKYAPDAMIGVIA